MGSRRGGMDIEAVAVEDPSAIITQPFPMEAGIVAVFVMFFTPLKIPAERSWRDLQHGSALPKGTLKRPLTLLKRC